MSVELLQPEPETTENGAIAPVDTRVHHESKSFLFNLEGLPYTSPGLEVAELSIGDEEGAVYGASVLYRAGLNDENEGAGDFIMRAQTFDGKDVTIPFSPGEDAGEHVLNFGRIGRDKDGSKYILGPSVSRQHAIIKIKRHSGTQFSLEVNDDSLNGTEVDGSLLIDEAEADWDYTNFGDELLKMDPAAVFKYPARMAEEPDVTEPVEIMYKNRRRIARDTPINRGVYVVPGIQEEIVVDDRPVNEAGERVDGEVDPAYQEIYEAALDRVFKGGVISKMKKAFGLRSDPGQATQAVFETVLETIEYDMDYSIEVQTKHVDAKIDLHTMLYDKKGVCRHMALVVGYIIERMTREGFLEGSVSIDRNSIKGRGGHAWVRYTSEEGEVTIIDPAQEYHGSLEEAQELEGAWNYARPGE